MALFSNFVAFRENEKGIDFVITLTLAIIFEKRATNKLRMHKIAISTLKSAFGF